jgi:hypothetical protein
MFVLWGKSVKNIMILLLFFQDLKCIKMNCQWIFKFNQKQNMIKTAERMFSRRFPNYNNEF